MLCSTEVHSCIQSKLYWVSGLHMRFWVGKGTLPHSLYAPYSYMGFCASGQNAQTVVRPDAKSALFFAASQASARPRKCSGTVRVSSAARRKKEIIGSLHSSARPPARPLRR